MIRSQDNFNREPSTNQALPDTTIQREADQILGRFQNERVLRPIARVRAWEGVRGAVQTITGEQVWTAWRRFKAAHETAQAGGDFDGLLELHDEFERLLKAWLDGPAA